MKFKRTAVSLFLLLPPFLLNGCDRKIEIKSRVNCYIALRSVDGGGLYLNRIDPLPNWPKFDNYQVFWHLPSSSPSITMSAGYGGELGPLTVARAIVIKLTPPENIIADKFAAEIKIDRGTPIKLGNERFGVGQDQIDLVFDKEKPNDLPVFDALDNKQEIKVSIFNDAKLVARATFNSAATDARNLLYEEAKHLEKNIDPRYCVVTKAK